MPLALTTIDTPTRRPPRRTRHTGRPGDVRPVRIRVIGTRHALVALLLLITGLATPGAHATEPDADTRERYARPADIPFPRTNPYTPEKATLGKMLFFDTRLSRDRNLSCASCHSPSFGWEVPFAKAVGAGGFALPRHAQTVVNLAWTESLYWDGRAPSLEAQAKGPLESPTSMDLPAAAAVARLDGLAGYRSAFAAAFPERGLSEETLFAAIATYERTIVTGDTPFDRWMRGDEDAISEVAKAGFALFDGRARCAECHAGWNFTDDAFHDIGLPDMDIGREAISGSAGDSHAFKTPGLREIASREPYMHDGAHASLEQVIAHYAGGGIDRPSRSRHLRAIRLDADDVSALIAFLETLSSPRETVALPQLPAR